MKFVSKPSPIFYIRCVAISKIPNIFGLCYKESFFVVFTFSAGIFRDILIQQHSRTSNMPPYAWFPGTDSATLTDWRCYYSFMRIPPSSTCRVLSVRIYCCHQGVSTIPACVCFHFSYLAPKKNHSRAVYKNTLHVVKPSLFKGVVIAQTTPDQCSNTCQI